MSAEVIEAGREERGELFRPAPQPGEREIRLALVCYGGVSLAIYMHGITKELQKLVAASTAYARDTERNPFRRTDTGDDDTAAVYWDLLRAIERGRHGSRLAGVAPRVVVDIISGTSAGGINGICLAKALVQGRSQDALRDVWLERGDIGQLIGGRRWPWPLTRAALASRALVRILRHRPPLRGDEMCRWLESAFEGIDEGAVQLPDADGTPIPLVPPHHPLHLFVPVTDFEGLERGVTLTDPLVVWDRTHRQILRFKHDLGATPAKQQFDASWNHALGFAARATSSFPGAFPPISPAEYERAVGVHNGLGSQLAELFPHHALAGGGVDVDGVVENPPYRSPFVDGGVLDNFPFGATIEAVRAAPASGDVDRRLLYVEPDPGQPELDGGATGDGEGHARHDADRSPGLLQTVFASYAGIPRQEPILGDLLDVARDNATVQRLRSVIETNFPAIRAILEEEAAAEGSGLPLEGPVERRRAVRSRMHDRVPASVGLAYPTYVRLRLSDVIDGYASGVAAVFGYPADSNHAWLVRAMLRRWAHERGVLRTDHDVASQLDFLEGLDLQYQRRRLRFLLAACHWWYRDVRDGETAPSRTQLDEAKRALYGLLAALDAIGAELLDDSEVEALMREVFEATVLGNRLHEDVKAIVSDVFESLERLEEATRRVLARHLTAWDAQADETIAAVTERWPSTARADLQARDLGFSLWDAVTYPVLSLGGVGERDHVEVVRMSPLDSTLLTDAGAVRDLKGATLAHFGAFFDRSGRERDYLWGRLDAAERLIRILLDDPDTPALDPLDELGADVCRRAFEAVLNAESAALTSAGGAIDALRASVEAVGPSGPSATPAPIDTAPIDPDRSI